MNKNSSSNSASTSKSQVTSKYFTNENTLDDSLKEFQEKKNNVTGPKNTCKNGIKKSRKFIKGQKDIRSLIKKQNDLVAYSNDFNKICKQSGVDIDAEQLQLAIALSNSLQDSNTSFNNITKPLTAKERTNKIRTTLQEYGFKVPETTITDGNKKIRKKRHKYKLLLYTNAEKQQIITDRYLQVLSSNSKIFNVTASAVDIPKESIYYKSTSIHYEDMKNYDTFYVHNLIEKTFAPLNLLRHWSEIPGRCRSPVFERPVIGFNDVSCSQDDLNILLSDCLIASQDLFQRKLNNNANRTATLNVYESYSVIKSDIPKVDESTMVGNILSDESQVLTMPMKINNCDKDEIARIQDYTAQNVCKDYVLNETLSQPLLLTDQFKSNIECHQSQNGFMQRSQSPDLFEDEVSSIMNVSMEVSKTLPKYDTVDLTQCIPTNLQPQLSNITKRLSNDALEITECVGNGLKDDMINLTKNYNDGDSTIIYEDFHNVGCSGNNDSVHIIRYDDQQNSKIVSEGLGKSTTDTFQKWDYFDLTQSSDSNSSLPDIKLSGTNKVISLEHINENSNRSLCPSETEVPSIVLDKDDNIDLTQSDNVNFISKYDIIVKNDDVSIDYDAMFDVVENCSNASKSTNTSISITNRYSINSSASKNGASTSQSEPFELSDEELNYSIINVDVHEKFNDPQDNEQLPCIDLNSGKNLANDKIVTPIKEKNVDVIRTPSNHEYIIKTAEVTPMQNFAAMSSPERNEELEKYGLKPLKSKRAIQLLTYIYEQTHPIVESCEDASPSKRLKLSLENNTALSPRKCVADTLKSKYSPKNSQKSPGKSGSCPKSDSGSYLDESNKENIYVQTNDLPIIKYVACHQEDWVFQKREKAKVHSCRVPLHIVFHNYVSCRRRLRVAILCFEPINIDTVHKDLVAAGYRYNPKDLLKFMDKKCITVKTLDRQRGIKND